MYAVIPSIADQGLVGNLKRAQSTPEHIPKVKILKLKHWRGKCIQAIGYMYVSCDQLSSATAKAGRGCPLGAREIMHAHHRILPVQPTEAPRLPPQVSRPAFLLNHR
jgi:hypothetical protein